MTIVCDSMVNIYLFRFIFHWCIIFVNIIIMTRYEIDVIEFSTFVCKSIYYEE